MDEVAQPFFDELEARLAPGYTVTERGNNDEGSYMRVGDMIEIGVRETFLATSLAKDDYRHEYDVTLRLGEESYGRLDGETVRSLTRAEWVRNAVPALLNCLERRYRKLGRESWKKDLTPEWEPRYKDHDERFHRDIKWPIFRTPTRV